MWTHHIPDAVKQALRKRHTAGDESTTLPTLPVFDARHAAHAELGQAYQSSLSCVSGHNMTKGHTSDHKFPHSYPGFCRQGRTRLDP